VWTVGSGEAPQIAWGSADVDRGQSGKGTQRRLTIVILKKKLKIKKKIKLKNPDSLE
jgi:ribosomal protein L44E